MSLVGRLADGPGGLFAARGPLRPSQRYVKRYGQGGTSDVGQTFLYQPRF